MGAFTGPLLGAFHQIGVNILGNTPEATFKKVNEEVAGIWVDNAMINENSNIQFDADNIRKAQEESRWQGLYFGGVAFKYQRQVDDLEKASNIGDCSIFTEFSSILLFVFHRFCSNVTYL